MFLNLVQRTPPPISRHWVQSLMTVACYVLNTRSHGLFLGLAVAFVTTSCLNLLLWHPQHLLAQLLISANRERDPVTFFPL